MKNDLKLIHAVSTPDCWRKCGKDLGEYRGGIDAAVEADEVRRGMLNGFW